ncbi:hypothetical protein SDC9_122976 [bioreactor metagenome]|uniref:Uncharacterized protein n=1 Tax=bioreactor metagenome TaxID=1076179 RepID=A0A645CGE4_9ZZZZ
MLFPNGLQHSSRGLVIEFYIAKKLLKKALIQPEGNGLQWATVNKPAIGNNHKLLPV